MRQGGLILAAGSVCSKKIKHERTGNSSIIVAHAKKNNNKNIVQHNFLVFSTPVAVSYNVFHVFPRRGDLYHAATTRIPYSWVSVVLMSASKRYCRGLSIEYSSSPDIGAVCEISRKKHDRLSSLLLKAP